MASMRQASEKSAASLKEKPQPDSPGKQEPLLPWSLHVMGSARSLPPVDGSDRRASNRVSPFHPLAQLQQSLGNQAMQRRMEAGIDPAGAHASLLAQPMIGNHGVTRRLQAKLNVNVPGDHLEQEADRVADQVMRMPAPGNRVSQSASTNVGSSSSTALQRKCECGGTCDECRSRGSDHEHQHLQMKPARPTGAGTGLAEAPPIVNEVLRSPGRPLDAATRSFMEPRFGHDFSHVRVHTDAAAGRSASDVNALAYAVGHNIVFGPGRFAPQTQEGRRLLAHELAHVAQQRGLDAAINHDATSVGTNRDSVEHAADSAAAALLHPGIAPAHGAPASPLGVVRRSPDPSPAAKAPAGPQASAAPKNSADAEANTVAFYPNDAALEKAFAKFKGIPEISAITDPAKRRAFLARMSLYLGPHPAAENHFAKIKQAKFGKDQWASEPVVSRLNAVHDELKTKGHAMPESGANFGQRGLWSGPVQSRGMMVHALGLALDYRADTNVHITEPRLIDLQSIFVNEAMRINVGKWKDRRDLVIKIAQGKATPKEITDFDAHFHEQFEVAALGSAAMKDILPSEHVARLSELSKQYRDLKARENKLAAREKKIPESERHGIRHWEPRSAPPDVLPLPAILLPWAWGEVREGGSPQWEQLQSERQPLAKEREEIQNSTSTLMDPVRQKVQEEMDVYIEKHPELEDLPPAEDLELNHNRSGAEFKKAETALKNANAKLKVAKKKLADATAAQEKASNAVAVAATRGKPTERLDKLEADATQRLEDATGAVSEAERAVAEATASLETAVAERDKWKGKYKFIGEQRWFERLRRLRDSLADDLDFMLIGQRTVQNPAVAQLLEKGYFNPDAPGKGGFDEVFMRTMAHHGFDQGAEWEPGGVDSMHFELAEEVEKLSEPNDAKQQKKK